MKRPLTLIVGTAAGAILIAGIGVSAHGGGFTLFRTAGLQQSRLSDEASGARLESPEPSESPEASPSEKPEPSPTAEPTEKPEAPDTDSETRPSPTAESGDHEGDNQSGSGGGDGHDD